jgi:lipopolysaccharide transport system permease protein
MGSGNDAVRTVVNPARKTLRAELREVWNYRELLFYLAWRDIKVRYKQAVLGIAWIVVQPVVSIVIFSLLFGRLLKVPSGDVPYPVFAYAALLPWNYFAGSLTRASGSLVGSASLYTKVYFPRLVVPLSAILGGLVDLAISFFVLFGLMLVYRIPPSLLMLTLPVFILLASLTALAFSLWLSALNVRYRDIGHLVPFLVQIWMYATPVVYGTDLIPGQWRSLLALNPMTTVTEGFRWALVGGPPPGSTTSPILVGGSLALVAVVLVGGIIYFRHTEQTFADVV